MAWQKLPLEQIHEPPRHHGCNLCLFRVSVPPWGPPSGFIYDARWSASDTIPRPGHDVPHTSTYQAVLLPAWRYGTGASPLFSRLLGWVSALWPSMWPPESCFLFKSERGVVDRWLDYVKPKPQRCTCSDVTSDSFSATSEDMLPPD